MSLTELAPLDAREGLVDIVPDELREVEAQALEVTNFAVSSSSIFWRVIPSRHSSIGRSGTLNSRLKNS